MVAIYFAIHREAPKETPRFCNSLIGSSGGEGPQPITIGRMALSKALTRSRNNTNIDELASVACEITDQMVWAAWSVPLLERAPCWQRRMWREYSGSRESFKIEVSAFALWSASKIPKLLLQSFGEPFFLYTGCIRPPRHFIGHDPGVQDRGKNHQQPRALTG